MSADPTYSEFEQGERQALLQVRSFIAQHGTKEVADYCAQRLHDIAMDARHNAARQDEGELVDLAVTVAAAKPNWTIHYELDGKEHQVAAVMEAGMISCMVPSGARILGLQPR